MKWHSALLVACCTTAPLAAQQVNTLLIGPGDDVHVQVFDATSMDETARVADDGQLPLLLGGSLRISGMTPDAAARQVEALLVEKHVMYAPRVLVTVTQYATENVTVFGQVQHPGTFPIGTPRSIIDVLALSGGLTETADRHVVIQRAGSGDQLRYFASNDGEAALRSAVTVYPGDRVVVSRAPLTYVLGDVGRPGGYPLADSDSQLTVLQAIALAGGTATSAVPNGTRLIRRSAGGGYTAMTIRLSDMQKGKKQDILLQPDDILYVPFSYLRNAALGITGIAASAASAVIYR